MASPFEQVKLSIDLLNKDELLDVADLVGSALEAYGVNEHNLEKFTSNSKTSGNTHKKGKKLPFWLKRITGFDETKKSAYAFQGNLVWPNKVTTLLDGALILFGTGKGADARYALLEKEDGVTTDVFGYSIDNARVLTTSEGSRFMPNEHQQLHGKPIAPVWKEALARFSTP